MNVSELLAAVYDACRRGGARRLHRERAQNVRRCRDGAAPTWSTGLNLVGLVLLFVLKVFVPSADVAQLDGAAATLAQLGVLILGLITQLGFAKLAHATVRGVPLIGKTHSVKQGYPL